MVARPLPVSKLRARRRKRRIVVLLVWLFFVFLLAAGIVGLTWLPFVRINTITITGASSVNVANATEIVRQRISDRLLFVLARDNALLYPKKEVEQVLQRKFSAIESVDLHMQGLNTLQVVIAERTTTALWCGRSPASSSPCFLLDGSGVAYAPAADFSGDVYVKYYGVASSSTARQYATPEEFAAVSAFVSALRSRVVNDAPVSVSIQSGDVRVTFASGFVLIYRANDNGADVLESFTLALQADPFTKHSLADFEYLDLRFGDKLYYKLK